MKSGRISPAYLALDVGSVKLVKELISTYSKSVGMKRKPILESTRSLEGKNADFRVVRGLCALIERRAVFETRSPVSPATIREAVFRTGAPVLDEGRRSRIIADAADRLGISPEEAQRHMWSDIREEMVLVSLETQSPEELIAAYNLSLTQTLTFKSTSIELKLGMNAREVLAAVKRLGLMYTVSGTGEDLVVSVEGPASTIKLTERYGTAVAKLLPKVFASSTWEIRSQIMVNSFGKRRLLEFALSSFEAPLLPKSHARDGQEEYDSSVEESFAKRFRAVNTGWALVREPGLIQTRSGLLIPDFAFEKGGRRIYMEIVGFWTPQYLDKKVKKLTSVRESDFIVAVNSQLAAAERLRGGSLRVIEFDREVPLRPVLSILETAEAELLEEDVSRAMELEVTPMDDVVEISQLASSLGIDPKALSARLRAIPPQGYRVLGGYLVSEKLVGEIREALVNCGPLRDVEKKLGKIGVYDALPVLWDMGYSVRWKGISPDSAEVIWRDSST